MVIGIVTVSVFAQDFTLKELEEAADLILIGEHRAVSIDGLEATVEIIPVRILKGSRSITSQSSTVVKLKIGQGHADTITKALNNQIPQKKKNPIGMWFLKNQEGGRWETLPFMPESMREAIRGYYVAISDLPLPNEFFAYEPSATVQTKLIKELGAEMERVWGNNNGKLEIRDRCLLKLAEDISIGSMDGVAEFTERFSKSSSERLQSLALSWRIRGGDSKALRELENERKLLERQEGEIAAAIGSYLGNDPLFIQGLGKLTSKSFPTRIREVAGHVLRAVHSKEAVPFLAEMLGSDLDQLKYSGVMGLASFALNLPIVTPENTRTMNWLRPQPRRESVTYAVPIEEARGYMPAIDIFEKDQTRYTTYWKGWWAKNRSVLEQP